VDFLNKLQMRSLESQQFISENHIAVKIKDQPILIFSKSGSFVRIEETWDEIKETVRVKEVKSLKVEEDATKEESTAKDGQIMSCVKTMEGEELFVMVSDDGVVTTLQNTKSKNSMDLDQPPADDIGVQFDNFMKEKADKEEKDKSKASQKSGAQQVEYKKEEQTHSILTSEGIRYEFQFWSMMTKGSDLTFYGGNSIVSNATNPQRRDTLNAPNNSIVELSTAADQLLKEEQDKQNLGKTVLVK